MRFRPALISVCAFLSVTAIRGTAQCGPKMEEQVAAVRNSWVTNWNGGHLDNVVNLYDSHADLLAADGSRASGQDEIRASLQKPIASAAKVEVHSVRSACSKELAYDNGTYTQTAKGQFAEGNYLLVLRWKDGQWVIVQHAATVKRQTN